MFKVRKRACETCIYSKSSPLDLERLEAEVVDPYMKGFFKGHRACHKHAYIETETGQMEGEDVCCRGFWNRHKDKFQLGQIAQRFGFVEEIE